MQEEGRKISSRWLAIAEVLIIIALALVPLFNNFPYRVNIFLSWEGAYRLSQGQIPYRDFGMPLGYMYWVIPAIFFKIFGPAMVTLVKAQVLINIISGLAFRSILKHLAVTPGVRFLSVLIFVISYSFFNFWPWYNHTVIVYQFLGLACLLRYISTEKTHWAWLAGAGFFGFCSFMTKQDGGALGILLSMALLVYYCISVKNWRPFMVYTGSLFICGLIMIAPFTRWEFGYWFNMGQAPHTARFSTFDIINEFLISSTWIKFYLFLVVLLAIAWFRQWKNLLSQRNETLFLLLVLGILAQAAILQVTSYTPPDNNIFFHSFALAFILHFSGRMLRLDFSRAGLLATAVLGVFLWWSQVFWGYMVRITQRFQPAQVKQDPNGENIVNRQTYMIPAPIPGEVPFSEWRLTNIPSFRRIYMPGPTADGLERLLNMDLVRNNSNLRVLNLTELTPLAVELPYTSEKGPHIPLWHHLGVGMFNRELKMYQSKIAGREYDLVLFQNIPNLNNFFPFKLREELYRHYKKVDEFTAPRRGDTQGIIEVFIK